MIQPGLVSVTFRKLTPATIIDLVRQATLAAIEWGGDIHVPHGDVKRAEEVGRMTRDAGLAVAAYGSYYRVGHSEQDGLTFESVLATAQALGAPLIRVWAGQRASTKADSAYRQRIVEESRRLATMASAEGLAIAWEFHGGTLTDTNESALRLLEDIRHPAMVSLWQATVGATVDYGVKGLRDILPYLANVHVSHCGAGGERLPLKDGADRWRRYFDLIKSSDRNHPPSPESPVACHREEWRPWLRRVPQKCPVPRQRDRGVLHYALLEFVRDNATEAFLEDAQTLKHWLMPYPPVPKEESKKT